MTQNEAPKPVCKRKASCFIWGLVGFVVLAGVGFVAAEHCPWFHPDAYPVTQNFAPDIAALNQRVDDLEAQMKAQPVVTAPTEALNDAVTASLTTLQNQVAQVQNLKCQNDNTLRQRVGESVAFWDLREAAKTSGGFTAQLDTLRTIAKGDTAFDAPLEKLAPYAAHAAPTLADLRASLKVQEAATASPVTDTASFWTKLQAIFHPLITIHTLHDARFAAVENELEVGDAPNALEHVKSLPDDAQQALTAWQTQLETRAAIDAAIRDITTIFTTPLDKE